MNLDMTDSMGPGKLVRRMQNPSYAYDEYLICIRLDQAYCPSYAKIRRTVVRHIQVHLYYQNRKDILAARSMIYG